MFLFKLPPKTSWYTVNQKESCILTQSLRNGMDFTPTQRYPWEKEVTTPYVKTFAKHADSMPTLPLQSHAVEPIQEWSVGWSRKPWLTLQRMLILKLRRNPSNNKNGPSWWETLVLREFILHKGTLKEQHKKNLPINSGIHGQWMDSSLKHCIKHQNLVGELMRSIYLQMLRLLTMAQNAQFTWTSQEWRQESRPGVQL